MTQKDPWYKDKFYVGQEVISAECKGESDFVYEITKLNLGGGYAVVQIKTAPNDDRKGSRRFRVQLYKLKPKSEDEALRITEIPYRFRQWRWRRRIL